MRQPGCDWRLHPAFLCRQVQTYAAVGSAQSRLLPQGRRFAELAGQSGEMDLSDQIDEVVREIQAGE